MSTFNFNTLLCTKQHWLYYENMNEIFRVHQYSVTVTGTLVGLAKFRSLSWRPNDASSIWHSHINMSTYRRTSCFPFGSKQQPIGPNTILVLGHVILLDGLLVEVVFCTFSEFVGLSVHRCELQKMAKRISLSLGLVSVIIIIWINDKNCSLSIVLTAMDQKQQKS